MTNADLLSKLKVPQGTGVLRAIQQTREFLDNHPDSLKFANQLLTNLGLPKETNKKKAYVFVMSAVQSALIEKAVTPKIVSDRANKSIDNLTNLIGGGAFVETAGDSVSKKGSKREVAKSLYVAHKEQGDERVIELIMEALQVTRQNAYTYVYLVKKDIKSGK